MKDLFSVATTRLGSTLALGMMALLGVFLALDGWANIFPLVEHYMLNSKTGNSAMVVIPVVVLAYLLGLGIMSVSHVLYWMVPGVHKSEDVADFVVVARTGSDAIIGLYLDLKQEVEVVQGASVSMVLLSLGASVEVYQLPGRAGVVLACVGMGLSLALTTPFLVRSRLRRMRELARVVEADWKPSLDGSVARQSSS